VNKGVKMRNFIFNFLLILFLFSIQCRSEEYFNDYSSEPQLKKYYGDWKGEKKQPCDVHEILPFELGGRSYIQEFDVGFIKVVRYGGDCSIGLYNGLKVWFYYGDKSNIWLHHPSGYIAKFENANFKDGDIYHVKLIYNNEKLTAQCIVIDKKTGKLIWDSGEIICEPIYPEDINYRTSYKEGPPYSFVEWNKENQRIHICASKDKNYQPLEVWIDNMKINIQKLTGE